MNTLELNMKQVKRLVKKAYEWRAKSNKRDNRLNHFRTSHTLKRFKKYIKRKPDHKFIPNKTEILLILEWFTRCPPISDAEKLVFTFVGLTYKLHKSKLTNFGNEDE